MNKISPIHVPAPIHEWGLPNCELAVSCSYHVPAPIHEWGLPNYELAVSMCGY